MRKLNTIIFAIVFAAGMNSIMADEPTFTITKLQAPVEDEGIVFTGSKYNAQIEIKLRNVTPKASPMPFSPSCLGGETFYNYPYVEMVNKNTSAEESTDHSFVEIKSIGEADILRVEFIAGAAAKDALLTCAASIDGLDYLGDYETPADYEPVAKQLFFIGSTGGELNVCNPAYTFEVPNHIVDGWGDGPEYTDFIKQAKYIRLNWAASFAGAGGNKGGSLNLFAIKVYTNADTTTTGIDENKHGGQLEVNLLAGRLSVSQKSAIEVFSIQGKKVASFNATSNADLSYLQKGVYIIKLQASDSNKSRIVKVAL